MGNPLRNRDPSKIHLVTLRTVEARLWMLPTPELNRIIGGVLARYQEILGVIIFAYNFLGNHFHLLVQAPRCNLDEFCENVNREMARRINWLCNRRGPFWERRYSDQIVVEDDDLIEAYLYIVTNAVHHCLARTAKDWDGLSCYPQTLDELARKHTFTHHTRIDPKTKKPLVTTHQLKLTIIPQFQRFPKIFRVNEQAQLIGIREQEILADLKRQGKSIPHNRKCIRGTLGSIPKVVSRTPRPICYTKSKLARRSYRIAERLRREHYYWASREYRLGNLKAQFPAFTFKPPTHRKPRLLPFTEIVA